MPAEVQQGIGRAAAALAAIGGSDEGALRASEVARLIGLGASTTARLLTSLEELGFLRREGDSGLYAIGPAIWELSSQGLNRQAVHRAGRAATQELARRVGLSANLAIREDDRLVYLCHFEGEHEPKSITMIGMAQPLHASGLGKALLLGESEGERRALLPEPLAAYTARTLTSHDALTADLDQAQARGWCLEDQELAMGRLCVAAPIRGPRGRVIGAISLSGRLKLMNELRPEALAEEVVETADRISVGLGHVSAVPR